MPKLKPTVLALCSTWVFGSCASLQGPDGPTFHMRPVEGVVQSDAHRSQALYQLGRFYQGQLRHKDAIEAYRKALAKDPKLAEAYNAIGVIYASDGRYEQAAHEFKNAIALAPGTAHFHNNLGYSYLLSNQEELAVEALAEAQKLDPDNPRTAANMKVVRERLNAENPVLAGVEIRPLRLPDAIAPQTLNVPAEAQVEGPQLLQLQSNIYELQLAKSNAKSVPVTQSESPSVVPKRAIVEVSNGNGVPGMAKKVAHYLGRNGIVAARITNQRPFTEPTTQIQYRANYKIYAKALNSKLSKPATLVEAENLQEGIDVRLVLGWDISRDVASFDIPATKKLASQ